MKINIITSGGNTLGKSLATRFCNTEDITISLSRKTVNLSNVIDGNITDLTNLITTRKELKQLLNPYISTDIEQINILHGCGSVVAEIPYKSIEFNKTQYHKVVFEDQLNLYDIDGDGINDKTYHSLISTFQNVLSVILEVYPHNNISIGSILSLEDKKKQIGSENGELTIFKSMIRANKIFRKQLLDLVKDKLNTQVTIISCSTVKTETEENFRKHSEDMEYWLNCNQIATELFNNMNKFDNKFRDIDCYIPHPDYETRFKNETDEDKTHRIMREIGLIKE